MNELEEYLKQNDAEICISKYQDKLQMYISLSVKMLPNDKNYEYKIGHGSSYEIQSYPFEIMADTIQEGLLKLKEKIIKGT